MKRLPLLLLLVVCALPWAGSGPRAQAQVVGTELRPHRVHALAQTRAETLDDYRGRLVLLTFFAHW